MSKLIVDTIEGRSANGNIITIPATQTLYAPGHVIQVQTVRIGPARLTIASTTPVLITGLAIAFTPRNANSRILIQALVHGSATYVSSYAIFKDGVATVSTTGQTNINEPNMQVTTYYGTSSADWLWSMPVFHTEFAVNTASRTYGVYTTSGYAGTWTNNINNRSSNDMAGFSYLTVTEIAV